MKKKIKNLTLDDVNKICNNSGKYLSCEDCPLYFESDLYVCYKTFLLTRKIVRESFDLNKVVEIRKE